MTPDQQYAQLLEQYGVKQSQEETQRQFEEARRQSVVDQPYARENGIATWTAVQSVQGPILPPWGTRRREWVLRVWDRHEYNTLWQGAVSGLIKRWCATDWTIDGGKILAHKFQRIFRSAASGEWMGWDSWLASVARDYLRFDGGAWIEVVGRRNARGELVGGITGLNHLDSYTTWPTGDPEYPCVYWSRLGKYHLMHRSTVIHLVDMPDGDVLNPGYGLCALSRAIAVVERQMFEQRYIAMNLNDVPSSGAVVVNNMTPEQVQTAYNAMAARTSADTPGQPGNVVWMFSMNPQFPASLDNFTFSRPPEKFDWDTYVRIDVNTLALAIGEDPQDLFPLQSSAMGSGEQSAILAKKGKFKMYGHFLKLLERELNSILPDSLEFQFKVTDPEEAKKEADVANAWAVAINAAGSRLSTEEGRRILANNSDQIFDVVTDERGELVTLPDTDIRPVEAGQIAPLTDPALASGEQQTPQQDVTATSNTPMDMGAQKDFDATRAQFVSSLTDLIQAGNADDVTRRRAGVVMRGQLNSAGLKARRDGLQAGGVDALSDADLNAHAKWLAQQSGYVTDFLNTLYKAGLTDAQVNEHAQMWANKSIQLAYFEGLESGDKDGLYEFFGDDGVESCTTCKSLQGKKQRMSEWTAQRLRPGVDTDKYVCGGWNCKHGLRRTGAG